MSRRRSSRLLPVVLALASAVLLIFAFPNFNLWWLAWVALVPWLRLVSALPPRRAFRWSWLVGALFFLGSIWWLIHVTVVGWLVLCAYLGLYFGAFGWFVAVVESRRIRNSEFGIRNNHSAFRMLHSACTCCFPPALWVVLEYARSHLLSGFGWNLLAYSQTPWRTILQFADLTGAWGVSFLIVLVNTAIAGVLGATTQPDRRRARRVLLSAVCCLLSAVSYGAWRITQVTESVRVPIAVVQGNIPQAHKWDEAFTGEILDQYEGLTRAAAATAPALIVWPETAVPGLFGLHGSVTQRVLALSKSVGVPLLVGTPMGRSDLAGWRGFNSAVLLEGGVLRQRYDKVHLVPFGEFVPFERSWPWLRDLLPPIGDFSPGRDYTVFNIGSRLEARGSRQLPDSLQPPASSLQLPFSVLICFEDVFPELARRFVREGARLLLVITNDAWFGPTAAAYQHVQASTLRAVELRVPIARAANTGWSGCLDASGAWRERVHDPLGRELFVAGTTTCDLPAPPQNVGAAQAGVHAGSADSFYLRWGDWFVVVCGGLLLLLWLPYNKRF